MSYPPDADTLLQVFIGMSWEDGMTNSHPKIKKCSMWLAATQISNIKYVKAEKGNIIRMFNYMGKECDIHKDLTLGDLDPKSKWDEIFRGALVKESFDDFITTLKEESPCNIVIGFNNVKVAGKFFFQPDEQLDIRLDKVFLDANIPEELVEWHDIYTTNPNPPNRPKTLILVSPSHAIGII